MLDIARCPSSSMDRDHPGIFIFSKGRLQKQETQNPEQYPKREQRWFKEKGRNYGVQTLSEVLFSVLIDTSIMFRLNQIFILHV